MLYDEPARFYTTGVWVEVLRFLFEKTGINGDNNIETSAGKITEYCNGTELGMEYDTTQGAPYYTSSYNFHLLNYIKRKEITGRPLAYSTIKVNCVDQGCAVRGLCGALGLSTKTVQIYPFGYIKKLALVGIGACNNPFITLGIPSYSTESFFSGLQDYNGRYKTSFSMHHVARITGTTNNQRSTGTSHKILDACAIPILPNGFLDQNLYDLKTYLNTGVDMSLNNISRSGR